MLMYDSDTPGAIPPDAQVVCLYTDRGVPGSTSYSTFRRWLGARWVAASRGALIAPAYPGGAVVLDVETGAATIADIGKWVANESSAFDCRPCVYISLSRWNVARAQTVPVDWWVADWITTTPQVPPGAVAVQYAGTTTSGGHYDLSLTRFTWPPGPRSQPSQEDPMSTAITVATGKLYIAATGAGSRAGHQLVFVADPATPSGHPQVHDLTDALPQNPGGPYTVE